MSFRREKSSARKSRVLPCGLEHDMEPLFVGLAAAEFMPADPANWFLVACDAGMTFGRYRGRVHIDRPDGDNARAAFLQGLLIGTPGANEALYTWMEMRRFFGVSDGIKLIAPP